MDNAVIRRVETAEDRSCHVAAGTVAAGVAVKTALRFGILAELLEDRLQLCIARDQRGLGGLVAADEVIEVQFLVEAAEQLILRTAEHTAGGLAARFRLALDLTHHQHDVELRLFGIRRRTDVAAEFAGHHIEDLRMLLLRHFRIAFKVAVDLLDALGMGDRHIR